MPARAIDILRGVLSQVLENLRGSESLRFFALWTGETVDALHGHEIDARHFDAVPHAERSLDKASIAGLECKVATRSRLD